MGKILTIDDLLRFCEESHLVKFDAEETGEKICVQIPSVYEDLSDRNTDTMLYGRLKILHTGRNRNGSNVTYDAAESCMTSLAYKPVLANFCEIDGVKDFTSHDRIINEDGTVTYVEKQIGCITADEPYLEYDEEKDRHYLYAICAIPKNYTDAAEIIERKSGTKVSCELDINKMSYNAKEKELILEDIEVTGVTCLGVNPDTGKDVNEGMEGARLDITDFSRSKNSIKVSYDLNLIEILEKLNDAISNFNIENSKEGGNVVVEQNNTFEEVVDDTFVEESAVEPTETEEFVQEEASVEEEPSTEFSEDNQVQFSLVAGEKTFSVSLTEKQAAISTLVNDTYSEMDNDYYCVDVYEEDKIVVMHSWYSGKSYRQSFKVKKDAYSLVGDRVEVFARYLTETEISQLEAMKANYAEIEAKLSKYEAEPAKMEILNSDEYGFVASSAEFEELKATEGHFDLSVEEVKEKADSILLEAVKKNSLNFEAKVVEESVAKKSLPFSAEHKQSRYGDLFKK